MAGGRKILDIFKDVGLILMLCVVLIIGLFFVMMGIDAFVTGFAILTPLGDDELVVRVILGLLFTLSGVALAVSSLFSLWQRWELRSKKG